MNGMCPHCQAVLAHVNVGRLDVHADAKKWVGISYMCPYCTKVISVAIDPIAVKTDTVKETAAAVIRKLDG